MGIYIGKIGNGTASTVNNLDFSSPLSFCNAPYLHIANRKECNWQNSCLDFTSNLAALRVMEVTTLVVPCAH